MRFGGKANLIIDDHVQRTARRIARQLAHIQRLLNHAFTRKGRITVNQNRHRFRVTFVLHTILFRSTAPLCDGVHELQMAWIEA